MTFFAKKISLLVCYTKAGRVIGAQGKIPWNLPSERTYFKERCKNKKIIMGRSSFEEIGHALSYCTIIILSRTMKNAPEGCLLARSFDEAIKLCKGQREILVTGGQQLYQKAMPFASKIYATEINKEFTGDKFFPKLQGKWKRKILESKTENGINYEYVLYKRAFHSNYTENSLVSCTLPHGFLN